MTMMTVKPMLLAALVALAASAALAQPGGGKGAGSTGAGSATTAPSAGLHKGVGAEAARWGADYTPGWALMTEKERNEHRERMRAMQTYEECHAYQLQHHERMTARAKERGGAGLTQPRHDACAGLKP